MNEFDEAINILCVDDEHNVLRALERIFLDDNYNIVTAHSGAEGLSLLENAAPFHIVISDYRMPVMNGVEFLKTVYDRWPDTVRIVLSGYADAGAIVAAINEGHIYKFIPKPWNDDEMRITIQNCLERYFLKKKNHELLRELAESNAVLEMKVFDRTEQLELRNHALEFSQNLLGNLPVGVIGIDLSGIIVYCNDSAVELLRNICSDVFGADVTTFRDNTISELVDRVRRNAVISSEVSLSGVTYLVAGHSCVIGDCEAVVLVFQKV